MSIRNEQLVHFLNSLVSQRSLSGEEGAIVELVGDEMRRLGFDEVRVDKYGSLTGAMVGEEPGPTLLLDAHVDTVGVAPGVDWEHEPFAGTVEDGRIYGRGTADMKGALAAMVYGAASIDRAGLCGRAVISATVMEEVMEGIALRTVVQDIQPDFVVIGEATDLKLNHGGRGRAEIRLETVGRPAHSSAPHLGVNAVHLMLPAIQAVERLELSSDPLLGDAIMALTDIISDPYPGYSVIPGRCRVTYDRRLLPGETLQGVVSELKALPALADVKVTVADGEHTTYTGATLRAPKFFPAWKLDAEHSFVRRAAAGLRAADLPVELGAYRFCTNGAHSAGEANIPTVGFGPAPEGAAHTVDEYVELEQLFAAARGYAGIIKAVLA
ncbi:MAG: YgeY family selenium metabolism-linked hydrolase [Chloroflexota bacterium]